jgi:hypothetical protein
MSLIRLINMKIKDDDLVFCFPSTASHFVLVKLFLWLSLGRDTSTVFTNGSDVWKAKGQVISDKLVRLGRYFSQGCRKSLKFVGITYKGRLFLNASLYSQSCKTSFSIVKICYTSKIWVHVYYFYLTTQLNNKNGKIMLIWK